MPREMERTPSSEMGVDEPTEAWNAAGISREDIASANNEDAVCAAYR